MKEPLVSVIMPTYNHAEYISDSVESVLSQTYTNWELIIVNNYSTDNTLEILSEYKDNRIKIINFNNDGIIARARNRGIVEAKGEYIAFLDSDDIWLSTKVSLQIYNLNGRPELLACSSAIRLFPGEVRAPFFKMWTRRISRKKLLRANCVFNSSVVMRAECIKNIGLLNEDKELRTIEDYDYWLRILEFKEKSILFIDKDLVRYRVSENNNSGISKAVDVKKEWRKYNKIIACHAKSKDEEIKLLKIKRSELVRRIIESSIRKKEIYDYSLRKELLLLDFFKMKVSLFVK